MRLITALAACLLAVESRPSAALAVEGGPVPPDDDDGPFAIAAVGRFVLVDRWTTRTDRPAVPGSPSTGWALRPGLGADAGADDLVVRLRRRGRDFALPRALVRDAELRRRLVRQRRRVGADFAWSSGAGSRWHAGWRRARRLGLAVYHVSNGGLDRPNHGAEALVLFLAVPVRR